MKLTQLNVLPQSRSMINVFGGYNHNLQIGEGEFYDMENLSSADYPALSPRPKRSIYNKHEETFDSHNKPTMLATKDDLWYMAGSCIFKGGEEYVAISGNPDYYQYAISMGAYLVFMPRGYYINTTNIKDCGFIEVEYECKPILNKYPLARVTVTPCRLDGSEINAIAQPIPPGEKNKYWIDTSQDIHTLKQWSETKGEWIDLATSYVKIKSEVYKITENGNEYPDSMTKKTINDTFEVGDAVSISGINPRQLTGASDAEIERYNALNSTAVIRGKGENYIIIDGLVSVSLEQMCVSTASVEFKRQMPEMDFVVEANNRLWGCKYGTLENGETVNEIYASKLGDPKNWYVFDGISTDSYTASVGSDGEFTGAITYMGHPIFFKENCMHKVYGNFPSNFQIQTTACRGVQAGCSKSLAILNETLLYKSRSAVCAYDGSLPVEVSQALGDVSYSDAAAGVLGNKYYISMKEPKKDTEVNDAKHYSLFVYDTAKGMWHREDDIHALQFCTHDNNLYFIDADSTTQPIKLIREQKDVADTEANPVKWYAISGIIGTDSPDKKYISNISVRMLIDVGATVRFSAEYDSCGEYEHLYTKTGDKLCSFSIPLKTRRCDHMRLKIEGTGMAKIFSICKTIENGGDA